MTSLPNYVQRIRPAKLGALLAFIAAVEGLGGIANNLLNGPITVTLLVSGLMLLFAWLAGLFWELRVSVGSEAIELGWLGPVHTRLSRTDIAAISVAEYPLRRFLGWGWRRAPGGDWAFSDVGLRQALVIERQSGKSVYITLRDPQAALAAVQAFLNSPQPVPQQGAPTDAPVDVAAVTR